MILVAHHTAIFYPGHMTKQISFQISTLGTCFSPCVSLSGKVHKLCRSHGSSHETLMVSCSQQYQFCLSGYTSDSVVVLGLQNHTFSYQCSNFLVKSFCSQKLAQLLLGLYLAVVYSIDWDNPSSQHTGQLHCPKNPLHSTIHLYFLPSIWQLLTFLLSPRVCLFQNVLQLELYNIKLLHAVIFELVVCI